jgi:hypothetical protein
MSTDDKSASTYVDRQTMKVVPQLLKTVPAMHHVDEMFQWLIYTIVQQFGVQVVQVWVDQFDYAGQMTIQLLTMARQDATVLEQVVVNEDVAQAAQRIVSERNIHMFRSVDSQFSPYRARMLRRYGLNYYAGCPVHQNAGQPSTQPSTRNATPFTQAPTFLAIAVLLFLKQTPQSDLLSAISFLMDQAVVIAEKRGLLLPPSTAPTTTTGDIYMSTPRPISQPEVPVLEKLIPRRKDEGDFMLSSNPFTNSTVVIKDKSARRLYTAIDGRMNVEALCESTGMSMKETYVALQTLLSQKRIEMHEANGRLVDTKLFLK